MSLKDTTPQPVAPKKAAKRTRRTPEQMAVANAVAEVADIKADMSDLKEMFKAFLTPTTTVAQAETPVTPADPIPSADKVIDPVVPTYGGGGIDPLARVGKLSEGLPWDVPPEQTSNTGFTVNMPIQMKAWVMDQASSTMSGSALICDAIEQAYIKKYS